MLLWQTVGNAHALELLYLCLVILLLSLTSLEQRVGSRSLCVHESFATERVRMSYLVTLLCVLKTSLVLVHESVRAAEKTLVDLLERHHFTLQETAHHQVVVHRLGHNVCNSAARKLNKGIVLALARLQGKRLYS